MGKQEMVNSAIRLTDDTGHSWSLSMILYAQTLEIVSCRLPIPIASLHHSRERPLRLILAYTQRRGIPDTRASEGLPSRSCHM